MKEIKLLLIFFLLIGIIAGTFFLMQNEPQKDFHENENIANYKKIEKMIRDIEVDKDFYHGNYQTVEGYIQQTYNKELSSTQKKTLQESLEVISSNKVDSLVKAEFTKTSYDNKVLNKLKEETHFLLSKVSNEQSKKYLKQDSILFREYEALNRFVNSPFGNSSSIDKIKPVIQKRMNYLNSNNYKKYFSKNQVLNKDLIQGVPSKCQQVHYTYLENNLKEHQNKYTTLFNSLPNEDEEEKEKRIKEMIASQTIFNNECDNYENELETTYKEAENKVSSKKLKVQFGNFVNEKSKTESKNE